MKVLLTSFWVFLSFLAIGADLPDGFNERILAENIDPVNMAITSDGRIFIAEKNGTVRAVYEGELQEALFLQVQVDNYNERGLQNIILDPEFDFNNYVYIYYTTTEGYNRISRFTANGNTAIPGSEIVIFELDPLVGSVHNGGAMVFGNDGKLYIGTGETGVPNYAGSLNNTHGKILRINKDGSIPEDNPFYSTLQDKNRAIYAYGFRNPFSMGVSSNSGKIFINDVGGARYEEVNLLKSGKNYGWPTVEGTLQPGQEAPEDYEDPFYAYSHSVGCAIVGATFYSPKNIHSFPEKYWNKFFYGDYCNGKIYYMNPETGEIEGTFVDNVNRLVSVQVNNEGKLYYLQRSGIGDGSIDDNTSTNQGALIEVSYSGSGEPFISLQPQSQLTPVGEKAIFSVYASGKKPLKYEWTLNDNVVGGDSSTLHLEDVDLTLNNAEVSVTISNSEGEVTSSAATLTVSPNLRPQVVINKPETNYKYKAGDTLVLTGSGIDSEDGELSGDNLSWYINFHHDEHNHPAMLSTSGDSVTYIIPTIGETSHNVWYRVYLTTTDSEGLTKTVHRDIYPKKSTFKVSTVPYRLSMMLEGKPFSGDTSITSVVGIKRSLSVETSIIRNDSIYIFENWGKDVSSPVTTFNTPEQDTVINAHFIGEKLNVDNPGDGLNISYYPDNTTFLNDQPVSTTKGNVDFNWGIDAPDGISTDKFYGRFKGWVKPLISGEYTFYTTSDDGVNLWVDNIQLVHDWTNHGALTFSGSIYLEKDRLYPIVLEYYDNAGAALVSLSWSFGTINKTIIPESQLYSQNLTTRILSMDQNEIYVVPNPFTQAVVVKNNNYKSGSVVKVYNSNGRQVHSDVITSANTTISLSDLSTGLYIIQITENEKVITKKVIKK